MDVETITNRNRLRTWLERKPVDWAQIIAVRTALRAFPFLGIANERWLRQFIMMPIRAIAISWAARNIPAHDMGAAAYAATRATYAADNGTYAAAAAYDAAYTVAYDVAGIGIAIAVCDSAAAAAADYDSAAAFADAYAFAADDAASAAYASAADASAAFWYSIQRDCRWLTDGSESPSEARVMTGRSLWLGQPPETSRNFLRRLADKLLAIDPNYSVWIDWYKRRIEGESAAFDIPGDKGRVEDKKILIRLAEATDEDFWGKGHEYVNATLKGWVEEARARVAPPSDEQKPEAENLNEIALPPPVSGATAFGLNAEGKLDPLPNYDQQHLRDLPVQRQAYADMREAALELRAEGQRLGRHLLPKLDRFLDAAPDAFEAAKAWPLWSAATALRTLYWKHKAVAETDEPDDAKLEPVVAVGLRGFLDIYNVFAFGDDDLRQKDEHSISPQERLKAEEQAKLSQPIQQAIVETEAIRTEATRNEIQEIEDNVTVTTGTPYADQALDQANRTTQNLFVGLANGAKSILANPEAVGAELSKLAVKGVATSAIGAVGYAAYNYAALIEFIALNAEPLKAYVAAIYQSYSHLPDMIDRIKMLWAKRRH